MDFQKRLRSRAKVVDDALGKRDFATLRRLGGLYLILPARTHLPCAVVLRRIRSASPWGSWPLVSTVSGKKI
jgi:hypothetical protein